MIDNFARYLDAKLAAGKACYEALRYEHDGDAAAQGCPSCAAVREYERLSKEQPAQ